MKYLLDTHTLIWHIEANPTLPAHISEAIEAIENEISVSIASLWEITIKLSIGKLRLPETLEQLITRLQSSTITILPIKPKHLLVLQNQPFHHRDPFDRLLIAQSLAEQLPLVSKDEIFDLYAPVRVWEGVGE